MRRRALTMTAVAGLAVTTAGCGDNSDAGRTAAIDSNPRAVAREYTAAAFRCGDQGAGRQYDLSLSPARDHSRPWYVAYQMRSGCTEAPTPALVPVLVAQQGDQARVRVIGPDDQRLFAPVSLILVRVDGVWRVDTSVSDTARASS
jgi:hypothetical protein